MRTVKVAVTLMCLLAAFTPVAGQTSDPLGLIGMGALIPYFGAGQPNGALSILVLASPVGTNAPPEEPGTIGTHPLHMFFYDTTCARSGPSVGSPLTVNDADLLSLSLIGNIPTNGLVAIGGVDVDGGVANRLVPLNSPIHARVLWINAAKDFVRVLEPITIRNAEVTDTTQVWSPLRTGAAFYADLESPTTSSVLILICPTKTVTKGPFPPPEFPKLLPKPVPEGTTALSLRVYDDEEGFIRDVQTTCECLSRVPLKDLDPVYGDAGLAPRGTYTEISGGTPDLPRSFTGYLATRMGDRDVFGRLHNGSAASLAGTLTPGIR